MPLPICKHLGCTVNWKVSVQTNSSVLVTLDDMKERKQRSGTPPTGPLDEYEVEEKMVI